MKEKENIRVLLLGNNPGEVEHVRQLLGNDEVTGFHTDISFDVNKILRKLNRLHTDTILVDGSLAREKIRLLVRRINQSRKLSHIPITLLKDDNREMAIHGVQEYVMKSTLTSSSLRRAIINSFRMKKTSQLLKIYYRKNKRRLLNYLKVKLF